MLRKVRARVTKGKIEPVEDLDLKEGQEVTILIEERPLSKEAKEAFQRSAGGWKGLVDTDQLLQDIRTSRKHQGPPIDLGG